MIRSEDIAGYYVVLLTTAENSWKARSLEAVAAV